MQAADSLYVISNCTIWNVHKKIVSLDFREILFFRLLNVQSLNRAKRMRFRNACTYDLTLSLAGILVWQAKEEIIELVQGGSHGNGNLSKVSRRRFNHGKVMKVPMQSWNTEWSAGLCMDMLLEETTTVNSHPAHNCLLYLNLRLRVIAISVN